jgi:ABC-2 type transport system ATP-binding protein
VFGLLGPNGAGKTTTIEILEGFRRRTGGQVLRARPRPERPTRDWRDRIGIVLQECELNPLLTGAGDPLDVRGPSTAGRGRARTHGPRRARAEGPRARGSLSGASSGASDVGVALVGDPDLLLPRRAHDRASTRRPAAARGTWSRGCSALGKTVVLTTHYMDEANHLADRVAILRAGEIAALGSPAELAGDGAAETVISFGLRERLPARRAAGQRARAPRRAGGLVTLRSRRAQRTLYELTSWAEREGVELAGLEARRPHLEDTFLELTQARDG